MARHLITPSPAHHKRITRKKKKEFLVFTLPPVFPLYFLCLSTGRRRLFKMEIHDIINRLLERPAWLFEKNDYISQAYRLQIRRLEVCN